MSLAADTFDYARARALMVEQQVRPWDVLDERVLDVIGSVPREHFVPESHRTLAYADLALPLPHGERMFKPVVEGRALQALQLDAGDDVLEIGTGSGYLTACLAQLGQSVHSLEIDPALAETARSRLAALRLHAATIEVADAMHWQTEDRYDAVCVTGAVAEIPARFLEWLTPNGRLFVIHGQSPVMEATLLRGGVNAGRAESLFETDIPYLVGGEPAPRFVL